MLVRCIPAIACLICLLPAVFAGFRVRRRRRSCDTTPCSWHWGPCSVTCGGGTQSPIKTRNQGSCGGCSMPGGTQSCNTQCCAVDCQWGAWTGYSACSVSCGGGTMSKTREISVESQCGGQCQGESSNSTACNTDCCPVDCVWGPWGEFGSCSVPCGGGVKIRKRVVSELAKCWGNICSGPAEESTPCNEECCPADCPIITPPPQAVLGCPASGEIGGLEAPQNGGMACTNENQVDSVCEFRCNDGFDITEPSQSTCLPSLTWSNKAASCKEHQEETCTLCRTLDQIYSTTACVNGEVVCDSCPMNTPFCYNIKENMCKAAFMYKVLVTDVLHVEDDSGYMSFGANVVKIFRNGEENDVVGQNRRFLMKRKCVDACQDPILMAKPQHYLIPGRYLYVSGPAPSKTNAILNPLEYKLDGSAGFIQRILPAGKCKGVMQRYKKKCFTDTMDLCYDIRKRFITCTLQDAFENAAVPSYCI